MVLKRIDRYITWRFLAFLAGDVCLLAFLYGSFDLLKRVEDIRHAQVGKKLVLLGRYYLYMVPLFLVDIVPALVLVAAGVLLVQMARTRELLVLKASGISLYRTVAPIFLCTFLISLLCFAFQQSLGPRFARQTEMLDKRIDEKVETELLVKDPTYHRRVFVGQLRLHHAGHAERDRAGLLPRERAAPQGHHARRLRPPGPPTASWTCPGRHRAGLRPRRQAPPPGQPPARRHAPDRPDPLRLRARRPVQRPADHGPADAGPTARADTPQPQRARTSASSTTAGWPPSSAPSSSCWSASRA